MYLGRKSRKIQKTERIEKIHNGVKQLKIPLLRKL